MWRKKRSPTMMSALPASVCLIRGQFGVPKRSAKSGQERGKKWLCMSIACILSAGMNPATVFAFAQGFVVVELIKQRRQVAHYTLQFHLCTVQQLVAVGSIPFETVKSSFRAWHLDDDAGPSRLSLRRVPRVFWQEEDVAFIDWNFQRGFARRFHHANRNISLQLIKEFFRRVIMVISPLIWSTHNRHHHLSVF